MRDRFFDLWIRSAISPEVGRRTVEGVYDHLLLRYGEPHRFYHGWNHVARCLAQLDLVADRIINRDAVELALWFHDAVYVPGAVDNEQRSADLFREVANGVLHHDFLTKIYSFTMLTRHDAPPCDPDGRYVVDIDLSSLASGWHRFMEDSDRIRKEQCGVCDGQFYPAQARFLQSLLDRSQIFYSEYFHARCERSARENIRRFLEGLRESGLLDA